MSLDWVATASDGSAKLPGATVPHPRSYGTFPRKVGHYSRDQKVVPLEHAIRSCTGLPADILGLRDRGYLRANYWADVVVFDPARIRDTATFNDPHKHSVGIEHVFVNGESALSGGVATGTLMGRALRHESAEVLDVASGRDPESNSTVSGSLLDEIRQHDNGVAIWWTGHNGWLIKSDGLLIGTDLVLDDPSREHASPISAAVLASELDISFVTHVHGDHFNGPTSRLLAEKSECLFVLPKSCMEKARDYGIPTSRIVVATPRRTMHVKDIKVQPLRAIHGNREGAVYFDANLDDCGYVIHIGGKSIMQPGDSVLLEDHLFLKHVDVLFFSPTEHNMQIENSITLINALEPDYIVPQHRDTYPVTSQNRFWTYAYTYDVRRRLAKYLQKRYRVVDMGARIDVAQ
jgi:L-ascorbate metabolism protein UlaG (beta-lactamase superfamily)